MPSLGFEFLLRAVPAFAPAAVRALMATCRFTVRNEKILDEFLAARRSFVGVCWHKDFLFALDYFRGHRVVVMVSRSRDGELVARTMHRLGYTTARGSSSAGGREALLELTRMVRDGMGSAFIADGPRGPARVSKLGPVIAARDSGSPIIPWGCHAEPSWELRNWDRTVIPKPYARVAIAFGEPMPVPSDASREECERIRGVVDQRMAELETICRRDAARGRGTSRPVGGSTASAGPPA